MAHMRDSADDILSSLGLARKGFSNNLGPTIGLLSAGIIVGIGVGMLVAPRSGRALREQIGERVRGMGETVGRGVRRGERHAESEVEAH